MAIETVRAWFLHKRPSGETSFRASFFTREYGVIEALYKGARSLKKQALLQPFMPLWMVLDGRKDWHYVRQLESDSPALLLLGEALFAGLYINEILSEILKSQSEDSILFSTYTSSLQQLAVITERIEIEPILRRFEHVLLNAAGYAPSFSHEATSGKLIHPELNYQFIAGSGFIVSQTGILGRHIQAISDDNYNSLDTLRAAKMIMRQAILYVMDGKLIQSRKLFKTPAFREF